MSLSGRRWRDCLWLVFRLRCFGCAVFLPAAVFWLRRFCCSGGSSGGGWYRKVAALTAMVRKDRKGLAGGSSGGWYRKVAALTAMVRKDRKGWAGGSSRGDGRLLRCFLLRCFCLRLFLAAPFSGCAVFAVLGAGRAPLGGIAGDLQHLDLARPTSSSYQSGRAAVGKYFVTSYSSVERRLVVLPLQQSRLSLPTSHFPPPTSRFPLHTSSSAAVQPPAAQRSSIQPLPS